MFIIVVNNKNGPKCGGSFNFFPVLIIIKYPEERAEKAAVLFISSGKSLLASRVYLVQSVLGLFNYPLGVGMGNFREISLSYFNAGGVLGFYSSYTHNIFLEAVSGVGIFALPLLIWGYVILKDLIIEKKNVNGWKFLFLTLTVIFMFDFLYIIPAMFWLWLSALGILQRHED